MSVKRGWATPLLHVLIPGELTETLYVVSHSYFVILLVFSFRTFRSK
jgi:hypothetical protein